MDLITMAREAGRSGQDYGRWTASDEVQDAVVSVHDLDTDALEAAFLEGRREWRLTHWRVVWTTAPADYDWFGTETVEECGDWYGKKLRKVVIEPAQFVGQTGRYGSGLHASWEEDPRIAEARVKAKLDAERAAHAEYEAKRAAGLVWLQTATEAELEDFDTFEPRGLRWGDISKEKKRRSDEAEAKRRVDEWTRCLAIVIDGSILVDDGEPSRRNQWGIVPGRSPHIYYNVRIVKGWPDDAEHANVFGDGNHNAGGLSYVADWITSGRLRVVAASDVPPRLVVERIGHDRVKEIRRVEVEGRVVWVGRALYGSEDLVLDEKGHTVRSKKILQAVRP
jgi:hypothetical protein